MSSVPLISSFPLYECRKREGKEEGVEKGRGVKMVREKRFYNNKETIAGLNYEIHQIIFHTFYATQMINPFLSSRFSANHYKKCRNNQPMV